MIKWDEHALQDLQKLEPLVAKKIVKKIREIDTNLHGDIKKLKGLPYFRLRIGDYRAIFDIDAEDIIILKITHRKNVYK